MVTCDGAGASHGLIERLDKLASRPGHHLVYSVGWELGERARTAIRAVPEAAWQIAIDHRGEVRERRAGQACAGRGCAHRRCWAGEAHVTELTGLLREGPAGTSSTAGPPPCASSPAASAPTPAPSSPCPGPKKAGATASGSPTCLPPCVAGGPTRPTSTPPTGVHARVGDGVRSGKDTGLGKFPSHAFALNQAWMAAALIAATLLAWLRLLPLEGPLAKAGPKTLRYRILHAAGRLARSRRRRRLKISATWPWAPAITAAWDRITALAQAP